MSVPLPAVKGTTNLMFCLGQSCAWAGKLMALNAAAAIVILNKSFVTDFNRSVVFMGSPDCYLLAGGQGMANKMLALCWDLFRS